jgi:putative ABC transport system permease protein
LIVTALFTFDSIEAMIDIVYFRTERQDATLTFGTEQPPRVMQAVANLPGVLRAEPARSVPVVLYNGHKSKRLAISAWTAGADLSQILDDRLSPTRPADTGLMLSEHVADLLGLRIGDLAEVELIDHGERIEQVPVSGVFRSYIGLGVYMSDEALGRLAEDGPRVSGARIAIDPMSIDALYTALKSTPAVASIGLMTTSRQRFREHVAQNVTTMTSVYSVLAIIITFGVIYNTARIQLSERARELASPRVLGFTRAEAFRVLFVELAAIALVAQPIGWALGFLFCWAVVRGFDTDLFRIPLVIQPTTFGSGSGLVLTVASFTAIMIRRRVARLDLVSVLKTRE